MSKRMGFQFRQPRSKMPKLDITISSSQRIVAAGPSNMNHPPRTDAPAPSEDAWGEDDDEFFVLASQAAEQVEANAAVVISQSMNNRDHDMSYIRFRKDVRTAQSTQLNHIDEFDNDEDLFSNVPDFIPNPVQAAVPSVVNKENNGQVAHNHQNATANQPSTSTANRMSSDDKAREQKEKIQTEFFAEKIKAQKKQIETLRETLNKVNQKCTTKEGEASTLRYEVDSKSRDIERLRKEKMEEAVDMEKKYSEKIIALEKKIEEQRTELEFKNIEILQKKSRKSLNESVVVEPEGNQPPFELHHLFKLHSNHIEPADPENVAAAEFLATKGTEKYRGLSERDFDTLKHLNTLHSIYNGAKAKKFRVLDNNSMKEIAIITNAFIDALKTYASRLTLRTPTKYNSALECKIISEEMAKATTANGSGSGTTEMLVDEKLIYERQMLAVIALLSTDFPNTTQLFLFEKCEESLSNDDEDDEMDGKNRIGSFVDILTDVLYNIGHSKTLSLHKTLIESVSLLLVALAKSYSPTELSDLLLLNFFRAIVFCEPDLQSLNHLSEFLEVISDNESSKICSRFCTNEICNVMSISRYKINRVSMETCPLQVFSCLLQISFQPYGNYRTLQEQSNEVVTVTNITIRMMKFMRNCFNRRVDWLFRKNESPNDTASVLVPHCYCYVISCIIVLLHFCISSWMENHKIIDPKQLSTIFAMGCLFLHDIIKKHYEPKVLNLGGFPVKNRLQAIYDWMMNLPIRKSSISDNAMKSVNLRQIQQLNEPQMISPEMQSQTSDQMDSILLDSFEDFSM
ncbi:uncharacterized protein LOC129567734 [Sitodiplosis mosellana]|uniref:uncharacterized protein LOC129567734 n=1 Tax=Sitodiplosis mosellana TaxID=263140 RepID=UPI00244533AA|nr:uncharacterized protein LOC129567734 [Sitodiplosis mosellana]